MSGGSGTGGEAASAVSVFFLDDAGAGDGMGGDDDANGDDAVDFFNVDGDSGVGDGEGGGTGDDGFVSKYSGDHFRALLCMGRSRSSGSVSARTLRWGGLSKSSTQTCRSTSKTLINSGVVRLGVVL